MSARTSRLLSASEELTSKLAHEITRAAAAAATAALLVAAHQRVHREAA